MRHPDASCHERGQTNWIHDYQVEGVPVSLVIGVTGGIAAYKACEVIRSLRETGAEIRVCMTESAKEFVSELTFATLSERPVLSSLFSDNEVSGIAHIDLARWCDLLLICPATANIIGKVAGGIADDAVSTTVIATRSEVIFVRR